MRAIILTLFISLFFVQITKAQSGFIGGIKGITPSQNFLDSKNSSVGINLGYTRAFLKGHVGADLTAFVDFLGYKRELPDLHDLDASTFYTGLSLNPWYCFNPQNDNVLLSVSMAVKGGINQGTGIVNRSDLSDQNKQIEHKNVNAGFALNFAPAINVTIPNDIGSITLSVGYDTSNFGKGINKLRSTYYAPINYSSGGIFLGISFIIGHDRD